MVIVHAKTWTVNLNQSNDQFSFCTFQPDDDLMFVEDQVSQSALLQGDAADTLSMSSQDGVLDTKARKKYVDLFKAYKSLYTCS